MSSWQYPIVSKSTKCQDNLNKKKKLCWLTEPIFKKCYFHDDIPLQFNFFSVTKKYSMWRSFSKFYFKTSNSVLNLSLIYRTNQKFIIPDFCYKKAKNYYKNPTRKKNETQIYMKIPTKTSYRHFRSSFSSPKIYRRYQIEIKFYDL